MKRHGGGFCKPQWSDRLDWGWSAITVTGLTVSLGLLGDIAPRFLTGGPDTFGAFTVSTQSILTLLVAGGALTKAGQEGLIGYPCGREQLCLKGIKSSRTEEPKSM